jgi:integrase
MEKKKTRKHRGLFERPHKGSGVWWINYYIDGKQHREKAGSKSAAIDLYRKRKDDAREGRKLPKLRNSRFVSLAELIDDALEFVTNHKDKRNYESKAIIVKRALGARPAGEILPLDIERFLNKHCKTNGTYNRYRAFISLCYRQGLRNRKVTANPARDTISKKESAGRLRFLDYDEYNRLLASIRKRFPEHVGEFIFSVHSGMRLSEQYSLTWGQVNISKKEAHLTKTKNGSERTVHLNADALAVLTAMKRGKAKDPVFPREGENRDTRSWFHPSMADAGIEGYVWHCNRHTFCSWLAMAGASIKEIQEAAGHKSISMSARYAHLSSEHKASVVDRIAGACLGNQHAPQHAPEVSEHKEAPRP